MSGASILLPALGAMLAAPAADLVPRPAHVEIRDGALRSRQPFVAALAPASEANRFALGTLQRDLSVAATGTGPRILAGLLGQPAIHREIALRKLDPAAARKSEGYVLDAGPRGVLLAASTESGLYYAVQTLRQLARTEGGVHTIPHATISDAPALKYRGLSIDISRGPVLTEASMREVIETLAEFKMNLLSFYMEHVFPYEHTPLAVPRGTGLTAEGFTRLSAYARRHHIDLVPQQQTFGHLHHLLKVESYSSMGERPHGSVLAAEDESAYEWIAKAGTQLARTFPSPFLHIGSDETHELGQGRSRELATRVGFAGAYLHHMQRAVDVLKPLNRRLMFWGDMALAHRELLGKLPKDLVAMTWNYDPRPEFASLIEPFRENGYEFFVCPGVSNWSRVFPNPGAALPNINGFVEEGKRRGALGMLNTHWNDGGEGLWNLAWYPVVFSAAAAWQEGRVDPEAFAQSFDWVFHRRVTPAVSRIVERFQQAHALFAKAGLGEAHNRLVWLDPFSASGARTVRAALPVAREVRLLAERNLADLERLEAPRRAGTLRYLALAAHRLNYIGMKIQFSRDMADAYRDALADRSDVNQARRRLRRFTSTDGLIEDLRHAILEIRGLYREAWLAENAPYWLDNVLLMYDAEALYWQNRARQFSGVYQDYLATGELPPPERLGLHFPEP